MDSTEKLIEYLVFFAPVLVTTTTALLIVSDLDKEIQFRIDRLKKHIVDSGGDPRYLILLETSKGHQKSLRSNRYMILCIKLFLSFTLSSCFFVFMVLGLFQDNDSEAGPRFYWYTGKLLCWVSIIVIVFVLHGDYQKSYFFYKNFHKLDEE